MAEKNQEDNLYAVSDKFNLCIKIKRGGYIPRSGLLLANYLEQLDLESKTVLDLGCGETGILAHYALMCGADITGVDIDPSAIAHVWNSSNRSNEIIWIVSDLFSNLNDCKFDIVVSNPPQMPMPFKERKKLRDWHDSTGNTGRETIIRILETAPLHLNRRGKILVLIFDFLGVKESFSSFSSLEEIGYRSGFLCEVVRSYPKPIRRDGQTAKNIPWIKKIYPRYSFGKDAKDNYYYNTLIVKFWRQ